MASIVEQRAARRSSVDWPVSIWHPKAAKFYNCRSVDVSSVGVLVLMPMKVPVRKGQKLEINFPRTQNLAKEKGSFARIKTAKVVRIDRTESLHSTNIKVGLAFSVETDSQAD